jgi:hypothetical protein
MIDQSGLDDFKAALAKWVEAVLAHMQPNIDRYIMREVDTPWRLNDDGYYRRLPVENIWWAINGSLIRTYPLNFRLFPPTRNY